MTLCSLYRCEYEVETGSDRCFRHQDLGRGEQHEPFDPELTRLRTKLSRIEALVINYERSDPYNGVATLRQIRSLLDAP